MSDIVCKHLHDILLFPNKYIDQINSVIKNVTFCREGYG